MLRRWARPPEADIRTAGIYEYTPFCNGPGDVGSNEERVGSLAHHSGEGRIDLATGAGVDDLNLQSETECSFGYLSQRGLGIRRIGRIDQHGNSNRFGHQVVQEPQPLGHKFSEENIDAGHIASRPSKAGEQPQPDGVFADEEDNRGRRGRSFGRKRSSVDERGDHGPHVG